jgi:hypothetical protein
VAPTERPASDDERNVKRSAPHSVSAPALVTALACALLSGGSCGLTLLDYGAHVDGPGIGLEWSQPLGAEYGLRYAIVLGLLVMWALLSLNAWGRAGAKALGVLALPALWFVGLVVGMVGGGRALPAWWKLGCDRGHPYACYAASGVTDGDESRALAARACAGGVKNGCVRAAPPSPPPP